MYHITEQLVINGDCHLTYQSILRLLELPNLTKLGDIQDWSLTEAERRELFSELDWRWARRMGETRNIMID